MIWCQLDGHPIFCGYCLNGFLHVASRFPTIIFGQFVSYTIRISNGFTWCQIFVYQLVRFKCDLLEVSYH